MALHYIAFLGGVYYFFKRREKRKIKDVIYAVFHRLKSGPEIEAITSNVFKGILLHYYEKLFNAFSSVEALNLFLKTHIESEGMTSIDRGLSRGKGVLLITGHFGGVEFIPGYLAANNYPVTILVRFSSDHLRDISIQKAEKFSVNVIDVDHTPNIIKEIFENLRENRVVITQCDEIEEWRPSRTNKGPFLGKHINCDRTMNVLVKRTSASVVFGVMRRDPNHGYTFVARSWEEMSKRFQPPGMTPAGNPALRFLESHIYAHPEEWYQWKKYARVRTVPSRSIEVEGATSLAIEALSW